MTETAIALYLGGTWSLYHVASYRFLLLSTVHYWWLVVLFNLAWAAGAVLFIL